MGLTLISNYFLSNDHYNHYYFNLRNTLSFYLFVGSSNILRVDKDFLLNSLFYFLHEFKLPIKNLNVVNRHIGRISLNEVGVVSNIKAKAKKLNNINSFNFILGLDKFNIFEKKNKDFNIYQGSFYISNFFDIINLILPTSVYVEHLSLFINLEGRFKFTNKAITPFKFIFTDSNVIESLSILLRKLYKENFSILTDFYFINKFFKKFINFYTNYLMDLRPLITLYENHLDNTNSYIKNIFFHNNLLSNTIFNKLIFNYYSSDIFCKKSKILTISSYKIKVITFNDYIKYDN